MAPTERLKDVLEDGSDVYVTMKGGRELDTTGAVSTTPWQDEAFRKDPSAMHRRQKRLDDFTKQRVRRSCMYVNACVCVLRLTTRPPTPPNASARRFAWTNCGPLRSAWAARWC